MHSRVLTCGGQRTTVGVSSLLPHDLRQSLLFTRAYTRLAPVDPLSPPAAGVSGLQAHTSASSFTQVLMLTLGQQML